MTANPSLAQDGDPSCAACSSSRGQDESGPETQVDPNSGSGQAGGSTRKLPQSLNAFLVQYQPILVIAGASLLGGAAMAVTGSGEDRLMAFMQGWMGLFLFPLAILKLFDVQGFQAAFTRYDLVAGRWPDYGAWYPGLELTLAILLLSGVMPVVTFAVTFLVMGIGALGILRVLIRGEELQCACVGTRIALPLGVVSIVETIGMAAMSGLMLAYLL